MGTTHGATYDKEFSHLAFSWWTVQWEMPKGFESKDALEICTLERILWRSVGDLAEGELIPIREATKEVDAVTYTWGDEVSGSTLAMVLNLVLFGISLGDLGDTNFWRRDCKYI